jgi:hypothetical protein
MGGSSHHIPSEALVEAAGSGHQVVKNAKNADCSNGDNGNSEVSSYRPCIRHRYLHRGYFSGMLPISPILTTVVVGVPIVFSDRPEMLECRTI